ncbi:NADH dehydrogenase [ubiquinone] 1 beta subcomplex subunit 5, mitochondrial [Teleopsis dalmanni]|uniref:NADH dehydrogenase [ubiquinone] 1 beta subcomplex subunit 5, mitochondrial n=1 Tax=Teleopsis dalmanni TaxID=139649 RepID=UPI0018CEA91D|nr:NADH dehydrogenase [ubiquinone] 1 beta subcomplex subunit 5, mitochondrial [Teleopsis dalmanni]
MVSWSSLVRPAVALSNCRNILQNPICKNALQIRLRQMSGDHGHQMPITPSRFQWHKFKDLLHFYVMLGLIPIVAITLYANIFVGPAQLTEIPPDYEPKYWEYHRHPISRFIARYIHTSPQQEYEKALHHLYEENEKAQLRLLEQQIKDKMAELHDYQSYYYRPITAKYHRISKEAADALTAIREG